MSRKPDIGRVIWRRTPIPIVNYCFCPSEEAWERLRSRYSLFELPEYPVKDGKAGVASHWRYDDTLHAVVTLNEQLDDNPTRLIGTIAHEAFHVVAHLCKEMADDGASEEFMAYMIGMVTEQLFEDYSTTRSPEARRRAAKGS